MTASLVIYAHLKAFISKALDFWELKAHDDDRIYCSHNNFATDFFLCVQKLKLGGT
jgi:hypothetical protein